MRLVLIGPALLAAALGGAVLWAGRHPALPEIAAVPRFEPSLVERGEALAAIGNCGVCHTKPGGAPYAGGRAMPTPFGTLYASNITPDPEHGIGRWSEAAFARALRHGLDRQGQHLYPVFPYDHYARVTDEDISALYAYAMTRAPVAAATPAPEMRFPFDQRALLEGWKTLFHKAEPFAPDPARGEAWNRGAYLVEGLGHCGACHTPRNWAGALDPAQHFAGAMLDTGWYAPPLGARAPDLIPWTEDALVNYLLDGWDADHGVAAGPMTAVVDNLAGLSEDDAYAIAAYLLDPAPADTPAAPLRETARAAELRGQTPTPEETARHAADPSALAGLTLFAERCANCHRQGSQTVPLAMTSTLRADNPANLFAVVREGVQPPLGSPTKTMPAFPALRETELRDLARFMRAHFTDLPPWPERTGG